jgi:DNA-binding transcriptional LysR family regulator
MTLTQLRAFLSAATHGTFTGAAADLRMSQPAVSDLVRRLEDELGAPLFVRASRSLVLTDAGVHLLPHAERCTASAAAGANAVRELRDLAGGRVTFGVLRNADPGSSNDTRACASGSSVRTAPRRPRTCATVASRPAL